MKLNNHQYHLCKKMIHIIQSYLNGDTDDFFSIVGQLEGALDASEINNSTFIEQWYEFWTPLEIRRSLEGNNINKTKAFGELMRMKDFLLEVTHENNDSP